MSNLTVADVLLALANADPKQEVIAIDSRFRGSLRKKIVFYRAQQFIDLIWKDSLHTETSLSISANDLEFALKQYNAIELNA